MHISVLFPEVAWHVNLVIFIIALFYRSNQCNRKNHTNATIYAYYDKYPHYSGTKCELSHNHCFIVITYVFSIRPQGHFQSLEVVDRVSETQLRVHENSN